MKILIKSRAAVERMAEEPFADGTAIISIADYGMEGARLSHRPMALLPLAFDDVENDLFDGELPPNADTAARQRLEQKYHMISEQQADEIAAFYFRVREESEVLICQCEHGQSRSAAVAAAILEYRSHSGITVFAHDRYYPNKVVFRRVLSALRARGESG